MQIDLNLYRVNVQLNKGLHNKSTIILYIGATSFSSAANLAIAREKSKHGYIESMYINNIQLIASCENEISDFIIEETIF